MDRECADLFNPKVIRSTMGSVYRVPFIITDELGPYLDRMKSGGVRLVAGDLDGEVFYDMSKAFDREKSEGLPQGGAGIMIGNEGAGLLPEILQRADVRLRIPMEGKVSSLNAAVSGALLMYEAARLMRKD
jgi:TrmH family RNA methyltransferase